jgi:hypothetical protein
MHDHELSFQNLTCTHFHTNFSTAAETWRKFFFEQVTQAESFVESAPFFVPCAVRSLCSTSVAAICAKNEEKKEISPNGKKN